VYRAEGEKTPEPVTPRVSVSRRSGPLITHIPLLPDNTNWRYAELSVFKTNPNVPIAVLGDHTKQDYSAVVTSLVAINTISQDVHAIAQGADFYLCPSVIRDGSRLSWIQWQALITFHSESNFLIVLQEPSRYAMGRQPARCGRNRSVNHVVKD